MVLCVLLRGLHVEVHVKNASFRRMLEEGTTEQLVEYIQGHEEYSPRAWRKYIGMQKVPASCKLLYGTGRQLVCFTLLLYVLQDRTCIRWFLRMPVNWHRCSLICTILIWSQFFLHMLYVTQTPSPTRVPITLNEADIRDPFQKGQQIKETLLAKANLLPLEVLKESETTKSRTYFRVNFDFP